MATPPDFVAGNVLTAAQMNKIGLWLIKTETIGTTVASVTVTDAFSADYLNYKIVVSGGIASTATTLRLTLGATTTGYYTGAVGYTFAGATSNSNEANTAYATLGYANANVIFANFEVFQPFATKYTLMAGDFIVPDTSTGLYQRRGSMLANTTSYTDFTLTNSSGTLTGGTIDVYGYRD
jgi:hypothetical protein